MINKIKTFWIRINTKKAIISTMPRSGTWWTALFFLNFDAALKGKILATDDYNYPHHLASLGIEAMMGHLVFPEFQHFISKEDYKMWQSLSFFDEEHYNFGERFIKDLKEFKPTKNPNLKIIYIYRNPLDQAVSAFNHFRAHRNKKIKDLTTQISVDKYIKLYALEGYLKQYLSYRLALNSYKNLLMIKYENIKKNPRQEFRKMCIFLGIDLKNEERERAFEDALQKVNYKQVKAFEKKLGRSIGNDQLGGGTHMRGGKVGKYRKILKKTTITFVKKTLKRYNLKNSNL